MRTHPRAVAVALVAAVALLLTACQPSPPVARERAAAWLVNQFGDTGAIPSAFDPGVDDLGATAYAVSNLAALRTGTAVSAQAMNRLAVHLNDYVRDGSGDDLPASLARVLLAVEATGRDPHAFGGTDLVARLVATMQTTGPDAGLFGRQDATYDGAFRQGLALAALSLVSPAPAVIAPTTGPLDAAPPIKWLRDQQCTDGSWMPHHTDLGAACAFDPNTFSGPDTNSTAMAELGLHAVAVSPRVNPGEWLRAVRAADGGWSFDGQPSSATDPDSTGLALAALKALGTPGDSRAVNKLISFQFGTTAAAGDRGAFFYPPFDASPPSPNLLATNDALLGLSTGVWPGVLVSG